MEPERLSSDWALPPTSRGALGKPFEPLGLSFFYCKTEVITPPHWGLKLNDTGFENRALHVVSAEDACFSSPH